MGDLAPPFTGTDQHGEKFQLADLRGQWIVLYFYPRDESAVCTTEACTFRDEIESFYGLDAEVVGVSVQDEDSHREFSRRLNLPFKLIADDKKTISRAYKVLSVFGWARRTSYLIDPWGRIRYMHVGTFNGAAHVEEMKKGLTSLRRVVA